MNIKKWLVCIFTGTRPIKIKSNAEWEKECAERIIEDKKRWAKELLTDDQKDWMEILLGHRDFHFEYANKLITDKNDKWLNKQLDYIDKRNNKEQLTSKREMSLQQQWLRASRDHAVIMNNQRGLLQRSSQQHYAANQQAAEQFQRRQAAAGGFQQGLAGQQVGMMPPGVLFGLQSVKY